MFNAYTVAVKLTLVNHVSAGLAGLAVQFQGLNKHANSTQKSLLDIETRLHNIKRLGLIGGGMAAAGFGGLELLKAPYEEAKKLAQAKADFTTMNLSVADNAMAFSKAAAMSHSILGTTITENIKGIHDLHTAFGDLHHAMRTADDFAKMSVIARVANGGKAVDGIVIAAAKALEHRGGKVVGNDAEFKSELDMMTKVMLATKMRVSPKDYLTASATGKMAYQMYDKEYLYGNFAGLMSINGGMRSGTEGMTSFSSLIGGHMDAKGKNFLSEIGAWQEGFSKKRLGIMHEAMKGLKPEERKTAVESMGGQAVISGGLRDDLVSLYAHRPDLAIAKLVPLVRKRFGMDLTDEQVALMVAQNLNRSTGNFNGQQITMALKLAKDTSIINRSMGISDGYNNYLKSPEGAEEAAGAAWKNFLAVFGTVYLPTITNGLLKLAGALDSMGQWIEKNQGLTKVLAYGFAGLSAALAFGGTVILLTAAFKGLGLMLLFSNVGGAAGIVKLGTSLGFAASGLGALTGAAALFAAAYAGWKLGDAAGNKINEHIQKSSGYGYSSMRDWLNDSPLGNTNGYFSTNLFKHDPNEAMRFVQVPSQNKPVQVTVISKLNDREIARAVTTVQSKEASRPASGKSSFDGSQHMRPVGAH